MGSKSAPMLSAGPFQYPRRVRTIFNDKRIDDPAPGMDVSVPSAGSNDLQPAARYGVSDNLEGFSTLSGFERSSTAPSRTTRASNELFQYPQRVRTIFNQRQGDPHSVHFLFQYPQRV